MTEHAHSPTSSADSAATVSPQVDASPPKAAYPSTNSPLSATVTSPVARSAAREGLNGLGEAKRQLWLGMPGPPAAAGPSVQEKLT